MFRVIMFSVAITCSASHSVGRRHNAFSVITVRRRVMEVCITIFAVVIVPRLAAKLSVATFSAIMVLRRVGVRFPSLCSPPSCFCVVSTNPELSMNLAPHKHKAEHRYKTNLLHVYRNREHNSHLILLSLEQHKRNVAVYAADDDAITVFRHAITALIHFSQF